MLVLDTSALLIWTLRENDLPPKAKQAIDASGHLFISSISIWEIALKYVRGRLMLPYDAFTYARRLELLPNLEIIPVNVETWLTNVRLDWDNRDPADRTIVALAMELKCPLVSSDRSMAAFYQPTIW
ncbi:MAG: type II toxin-antitoxin system VapC family toxin [Candidatus Promineofilum sp.]|jgi:PIN domain nuclease of toxin-antitoxin system|nr:type II toxin-antitoxin system VapC family toxin [Promineifilum sp.]